MACDSSVWTSPGTQGPSGELAHHPLVRSGEKTSTYEQLHEQGRPDTLLPVGGEDRSDRLLRSLSQSIEEATRWTHDTVAMRAHDFTVRSSRSRSVVAVARREAVRITAVASEHQWTSPISRKCTDSARPSPQCHWFGGPLARFPLKHVIVGVREEATRQSDNPVVPLDGDPSGAATRPCPS